MSGLRRSCRGARFASPPRWRCAAPATLHELPSAVTTIERRSLAPDEFVARVAELGLHLADYEDVAT